MLGEIFLVGYVFSEKDRGHGGFKVIIDVVYGVFIIEN